MSGSSSALPDSDDPVLDQGVLAAEPVLEFAHHAAVALRGGLAVLRWRDVFLRAQAHGIAATGDVEGVPTAAYGQVVVRVSKGRAATQADLASAWRCLRPDGSLLLQGGNALGIVSWVKRLSAELGQSAEMLVNRAHGRVVRFRRTAGAGPLSPPPAMIPFDAEEHAAHRASLIALPGVFSGDELDEGTALLLAQLPSVPAASRVLDLGCGIGHLALNALRRWPEATAELVDADHGAVRSAQENLRRLGWSARAKVGWWDAAEPLPVAVASMDLVLVNPPCHAGVAFDFSVARRMFQLARQALRPGGRMLVVANRRLPYEADLAALGASRSCAQERGFKVIEVLARA